MVEKTMQGSNLCSLPYWDGTRFHIDIDCNLLDLLNYEMQALSSIYGRPSSFWELPDELRRGSMMCLLPAWCGDVGQLELRDLDRIANISGSTELISEFHAFLKLIDYEGLLDNISINDLAERNWCVMDIGSLMDFLLVRAFTDFSRADGKFQIMEIGGGFGRLAEFFLRVMHTKIQYINVDAVPVSLMYSYHYLRKMLPAKTVTIVTSESPVLEDTDILIVPSWHLNKLQNLKADLSINVESMQEMDQHLVDYYIDYIDQITNLGGLIYLVNSRDYKFKGEWRFPSHWCCLLRHNTPRSWTINHPHEIFIKSMKDSDYCRQNYLRNAFFIREIRRC